MGTEWHTGIVEDEVGHSGAKQLFSGLVVWSIFHNGIQVKSSEREPHFPSVFFLGRPRLPLVISLGAGAHCRPELPAAAALPGSGGGSAIQGRPKLTSSVLDAPAQPP